MCETEAACGNIPRTKTQKVEGRAVFALRSRLIYIFGLRKRRVRLLNEYEKQPAGWMHVTLWLESSGEWVTRRIDRGLRVE